MRIYKVIFNINISVLLNFNFKFIILKLYFFNFIKLTFILKKLTNVHSNVFQIVAYPSPLCLMPSCIYQVSTSQ